METNIIASIFTLIVGIGMTALIFRITGTNNKLDKNQKILRWVIIISSLIFGIGYFLYIAR